MEEEVLRQMRKIVGWLDGDGIFCPGGSLSNGYAISCARFHHFPEIKVRFFLICRYFIIKYVSYFESRAMLCNVVVEKNLILYYLYSKVKDHIFIFVASIFLFTLAMCSCALLFSYTGF